MKKSATFLALFICGFLTVGTMCSCRDKTKAPPKDAVKMADVQTKNPSATAAKPPENYMGIVAYVNKHVIMHSDVVKASAMMDTPESYQARLKFIIDTLVVLDDAEVRGVTVKDKDVDAEVEDYITDLGGRDKVSEKLVEKGLTIDDLRTRVRERMIVREYFKTLIPQAMIAPEEVRVKYEELRKTGLLRIPDGTIIKEIELKYNAQVSDPNYPDKKRLRTEQETRELADKIRKLADKEDFLALAKQYSEAIGKDKPCYTGKAIDESSLKHDIREVIQNLKVGEISAPFENKDAKCLWIVKVLERNQNQNISLEEKQKDLVNRIVSEKNEKEREKRMNELRTRAYIKVVEWAQNADLLKER